jgi:site-specific recombinase XerD
LKPLPRRTLWAVFGAALKDTPITKAVSPHGLRHAFATHSLESGIDIGVLKDLLGHAHLSSTEIYVQVSRRQISRITSPLDLLHQPGPGGDILG